MRGKTYDDVLEGGVECPDLVAFSVYDKKPLHCLSIAAESFVWNINECRYITRQLRKRSVYSSIALSCKFL